MTVNVDAAVQRLLDISGRQQPTQLVYAVDPRQRAPRGYLASTVLTTPYRPPPGPYVCPHCGGPRR